MKLNPKIFDSSKKIPLCPDMFCHFLINITTKKEKKTIWRREKCINCGIEIITYRKIDDL
jgi:hypothetical protein